MIFCTVDPGIDVTGVAVWDTTRSRGTLPELAACALVSVQSLRSSAHRESLQRCGELAAGLMRITKEVSPARVYIEIPPTWHAARERGTMRRTSTQIDALFKLNRSIGALAIGADSAGAEVLEMEASRVNKETRLMVAEECARQAGRPVPRNEDERSAVWMGLELLTTRTIAAGA